MSRSPSWGAWIETFVIVILSPFDYVAPPRGERGLKPSSNYASHT